MWKIVGFDDSDKLVFDYYLDGMSPAEFARVLGFDERTYYDGYEYELTEPMKVELARRLGLEFDPAVEYFAGERAEFDGQRSHGLAHFADTILPLRSADGNRLTFTVTDDDLEDDEIALLISAHTRYPPKVANADFTEIEPDATHLAIARDATAVLRSHDGNLLLLHRPHATLVLRD
ncbi:hypothetical protein V5P93_004607 [Actinokineospora auranticolor]|uniref:Uncharacterized protein n=1 Tax=Actinokineospora auranticolor TaxID=155976 RepID=A0A2S6GSX3_9PSEU|nr:hypothetical protein [Actinokineospora auranticolor]PPK68289.1 hypothetical protein CLV40_10512 [Actinokineospora auranticolor]